MTGKPTLVQLEYIVAVDNFRHFATAAEKCFVTQPTLSMQIQKLEDQLGVRIFDRSKHPVAPTASGKRIIAQARKILNESYLIDDIIAEEKEELKGELHIGIIPTVAPYLLPKFISTFVKKFPDIHIHIEEQITEQVIVKLKKRLIDVGIVATPLNDKDLIENPLYYEKFLGYVSKNSSIFNQKQLSLARLKSEKVWILDEGHCFRDQVISICDLQISSNQDTAFSYKSGSLEAIKRLVDVHGGVTLLPELAEAGLSKTDHRKIRPIKGPVPTREVSIVTTANYLKRGLIKVLEKEILRGIPDNIRKRRAKNIVKWR